MTKKWKKMIVLLLFFSLAVYFITGFYDNLETTNYTVTSADLPASFSGYKIAFISDFHSKECSKNNNILLNSIEKMQPDLIVFTGDMIDKNHVDLSPVKELLKALANKYPMYAVDGNHERDIPSNYDLLLTYYKQYGVVYLEDDFDLINKAESSIGIYGRSYREGIYGKDFIAPPDIKKAKFNILLYHDSLAFPITSGIGFSLILSGHTHGGLIRLPIVGGLLGNNGELFPPYDNGIYTMYQSQMVVSRGIGDSVIPRFYNPSQLICVTLVREE